MSRIRLRLGDIRVPADAKGVSRGGSGEPAAGGLAGHLSERFAAHQGALAGSGLTPEGLAKQVAALVRTELKSRGAGSAGGGP